LERGKFILLNLDQCSTNFSTRFLKFISYAAVFFLHAIKLMYRYARSGGSCTSRINTATH